MEYLLAEDVFKATLLCDDERALGELWLSFFNDTLIPANSYSNILGSVISLPLTIEDFYSLVIDFMECEDTEKVCEFFKGNLSKYIGEQELEPDSCMIKVCSYMPVYEVVEE